jgi:hypothetical protein
MMTEWPGEAVVSADPVSRDALTVSTTSAASMTPHPRSLFEKGSTGGLTS